MEVHFINVGFGNMTLIRFPDGTDVIYDCNITDENWVKVITYVAKVIGIGAQIDIFINSHRDADHMRGIQELNKLHEISIIWDSGVSGENTNTPEYRTYMEIRRSVFDSRDIQAGFELALGDALLTCLNSKWSDYSTPNEQSLVFKIDYKGTSLILGGDTNYRPWKEKILKNYTRGFLRSSVLLAPHHSSKAFFEDPSDEESYFTEHISCISPDITIISVGPNPHGLPDGDAIELYESYSRGSSTGDKIYKTEDYGNLKLNLKGNGDWELE